MSLCQITLEKLCRLIFIGGWRDGDAKEEDDGAKLDLRLRVSRKDHHQQKE